MALTPAEQQELAQLEAMVGQQGSVAPTSSSSVSPYVDNSPSTVAPEDASTVSRVLRGVDTLQSTGGRAVQAFGELFGSEELVERAKAYSERQTQEADSEAPQAVDFKEDAFGFLGDALAEGVPSIGALAAGAGVGAAAGSFIPVIGTTIGGVAGFLTTAFGLNLGTAKEVELSIDPDSEADIATVLTAGGMTLFDAATGGAVGQSAKSALKQATTTAIAKNVAKDTAIGVGSAVGAQVVLDTGATLSTEAGFDEDRINTIADNSAAAFLVGAAATPALSFGGQVLGKGVAERNKALEENSAYRVEEDGSLTYIQPNPEAMRSTDVLKKAVTSIGMGRSVDELIMSQPDNLTLRSFASEVETTFDERVRTQGKNTVNVESQIKKGKWMGKAKVQNLDILSKAGRSEVKSSILRGETTELNAPIKAMFKEVRQLAVKAGIKMGDLGDGFYPFIADVKKIRENKQGFIDDMIANAPKGADLVKFREKVVGYANRVADQGGDLNLGDATPIPKEILDIYDEYIEKGGNSEALQKKLRQPITSLQSKGNVNKNNGLEQHRELSEVKGEVLDKWAKDIDILEVLDMYTQSAAERISYAERFGANNEQLHAMARLAQLEGLEKGKPVSPAAIEKMYHIADLQQRVTAKRVSPEYRDRVRAIKTTMNVLTLPLAVLSSLIEPIFIAPRTGGKPFLVGGVQAIETSARKLARTMIKSVPRSQREDALQGMNTGYREALATVSARHGEDLGSLAPTKIDQGLFKYNLLAPWTEFTRMWGQFSALEAFKQDSRMLNDFTKSNGQRAQAAQRLAEAGVEPNKAREWERRGSRQDDPLFEELQAGAINLVEDIVFRPDAVRKPTWMSNPHWLPQLFGQLKTYPITFTNRLAVPVANKLLQTTGFQSPEMLLKTVTTMGVLTSGFVMQDALKAVVRDGNLDKWEDKTQEERILSAFMQLGGTSLFADPVAAESYGGSALEATAGPALSKGANAFGEMSQLLMGEITPEEYLKRTMAIFVPNVPAVGIVRDTLKE